MLSIYTNTEQVKFWIEQSKTNNFTPINVVSDINEWTRIVGDKLAVLEFIETTKKSLSQANELYILSNKQLIIFLPEFVDDTIVRAMDLPGVTFFLGGILNYQLINANSYLCPYFFWSTVNFYKSCPEILSYLTHGKDANKFFDILLGTKKIHRDLIYSLVKNDNNITKYINTNDHVELSNCDPERFLWPSLISPLDNSIASTVEEVNYNGTIVSLSQVVPVEIYNQSYYSWVAESQFENGWSFFTEKIVKPILSRRVFIVTAGKHYLKNLQSLGFKTFSDVVDESYDSHEGWEERVTAAYYAYKSVINRDPLSVRNKLLPITEHNYAVMFDTNWQENMCTQLKSVLINSYFVYK